MQLLKVSLRLMKNLFSSAGVMFSIFCLSVILVSAQKPTDTTLTQTSMTPAAMAGPSPMAMPGMTGALKANPNPTSFDAGLLGKKVYITGAVSGIGQWQNNVIPGDRDIQSDVSNAQIFIQKTDGIIQYFLQLGGYSLPDIGVPYVRAGLATYGYYGLFPQGFIKIAPTKEFSIQVGKLPTLMGAEYTFSFENFNIQRGLLWNQENAVNRGVQLNYAKGPITLAASWNDGLYSNKYSWGWLSAAYAINSANTLTLIGGGNMKHNDISTFATPLYLNNEQIYNLIYTHTSDRWTIEPYLQYTSVPQSAETKTTQDATTFGAALFVNYAAHSNPNGSNVNLPFRVEYINSTGSADKGAPNLLYGPGSNAWSFTVTPTYQYKSFFGRAEFSYVMANKITDGSAFGPAGTNASQARMLLEVGILF